MSARRSIPLPRVTTRHESPLVSTTNQSINPNTIAMGNESINRRASSSLVLLRARDLVVSTREIPETRSPSTRDARPRRVLARSRVARCRGMGVASAPARAVVESHPSVRPVDRAVFQRFRTVSPTRRFAIIHDARGGVPSGRDSTTSPSRRFAAIDDGPTRSSATRRDRSTRSIERDPDRSMNRPDRSSATPTDR